LLQTANLQRFTLLTFRHLGAVGLLLLAILDSSPIPTFCGPDVLIVILVSTRSNPWYEYPAVAAVGSVIGAYITFRLARKAGQAYLASKFGEARASAFMEISKEWGTGALIASAAVPFPFPTSLVFAATGVSEYRLGKFITVVALARGARYTGVAYLAHLYGRHLVRILLHPAQYWGWLLVCLAAVLIVIGAGFLVNRRILGASHAAPAR
jgi:membrane protein YqaA with SNARE-associated domain